jgi:murein DD-endopeptidase MepM/ murein hydrolase activator NlpD
MGIYVTQGLSNNIKQRPPGRLKKRFVIILGACSIALIIFGARFIRSRDGSQTFSPHLFEVGPASALETPVSLFDNFYATRVRIYDEILSGENLSSTLRRLNVAHGIAEKLSSAIGRSANLKLLLPGDGLMIESASPRVQLSSIGGPNLASSIDIRAIELFIKDEDGVANRIRAEISDSADAGINVSIYKPNVFKEHALLNGIVTSTIYGAITASDGDAQLVNSFSDIFIWQFDFYKDTREGDSYQMIVEKQVSDGRFIGYGKVLAAEYSSAGKTLRGFYFESGDRQISGFFDDKGLSLKNAFLKAPLKLASISSRFGMRFHPVQKRLKPHNGVDYGANRGTPFLSVASGTVVNAGYSPFNGNWVRVRHANGYETEYLHATHLAKGVRVGAHVKQGQVIGYVGKTGLATGYHLHFGMKQNGKYVNPSAQKFAPSAGVPAKYMTEFKRSIEAMVIALNRQSPERQKVLAQK